MKKDNQVIKDKNGRYSQKELNQNEKDSLKLARRIISDNADDFIRCYFNEETGELKFHPRPYCLNLPEAEELEDKLF